GMAGKCFPLTILVVGLALGSRALAGDLDPADLDLDAPSLQPSAAPAKSARKPASGTDLTDLSLDEPTGTESGPSSPREALKDGFNLLSAFSRDREGRVGFVGEELQPWQLLRLAQRVDEDLRVAAGGDSAKLVALLKQRRDWLLDPAA